MIIVYCTQKANSNMDTNIKIIEGVMKFPSLHGNSESLDERTKAWIELGKKLKMPEQFLKHRWHSLLQNYQRDGNFKYANYMRFVNRNSIRKKRGDNWPEFVITEEFLRCDNAKEQEQFVLLETDDIKLVRKESSETKKECDEIDNKENNNNNQEVPGAENKTLEHQLSSKRKTKQNDGAKAINMDIAEESDRTNVTSSNVEDKEAVPHIENNKSFTNDIKEAANKNPQNLIIERCEDVIFGELVSAMLKRMDENKKKNIKKEIMNILFS